MYDKAKTLLLFSCTCRRSVTDGIKKLALLLTITIPLLMVSVIRQEVTRTSIPLAISDIPTSNVTCPSKAPLLDPTKEPDPVGEWVTGRIHKETCNLRHIHGCCGNNRKGRHYVFKDDSLNNYDLIRSILNKIRGRNVTILGDSLQHSFFEDIAEVLNLSNKTELLYNFKANDKNKTAFWKIMKHNSGGWLQYLYFYYYTDKVLGCKGTHGERFKIDAPFMKTILSKSDIVIANLGLHYHFCSVIAFSESLRLLSEVLQEEILRNKHKQVVFRATLPQHFISKAHTGFYEKYNPNATCATVESRVEHPTNYFLKETARKYKFKYLDNYHIYKGRFDLHSRVKKGDCTHYCHCAELTMPELVLLDQLLH